MGPFPYKLSVEVRLAFHLKVVNFNLFEKGRYLSMPDKNKSSVSKQKDGSFSISDPLMGQQYFAGDIDQWRLHLIKLVHLLGSAFVAPHFGKGSKAHDDTFDQLILTLNELRSMPNHPEGILICDSGYSLDLPQKGSAGYTVFFSDIIIDRNTLTEMSACPDPSLHLLLKKFQIALDIFSLNKIHDLYLRLPNDTDGYLTQLRICLEILSHFDQVAQSDSTITCHEDEKQITLPIIKTVHEQADPNLTLVAAVNHLSTDAMEEIKRKVTAYTEKHLFPANPKIDYTLFNVMFRVKGLKEKLILPPVEINNAKWHMTGTKKMAGDPNDAIPQCKDSINADLSVSNQGLFRCQKTEESKQQNHEDQILELTESIKNNDSQQTLVIGKENKNLAAENGGNVDGFINGLKRATDLLVSMEQSNGNEILTGIIESLQQTLSKETVFSKYDVSFEIVKEFHFRILDLLSRYKRGVETRIKDRSSNRNGINFQHIDPGEVAERFELSISEIKILLQLLEGCFDSKGHFLKTEFETRVPQFILHEKKVFEFLWEYLNEPLQKNDRVAFLNALFLLISRMKEPQKALSFLLDEIYRNPSKISYSDRNAFMLASLFLRNYNKELSVDIELTPAEVLLIKNSLKENILQYACARINADQRLIKEKLKTVRVHLIQSYEKREHSAVAWTSHFLLSLEREAFIFFSLVAGKTSRHILIEALAEYGNPKSKIYEFVHEEKTISFLLQHLKLLIKGLGRIGDIEDLGLLTDLKKYQTDFVEMVPTSQHEKNVNQVFRTIDIAMGNITSLE